MKYQKIMAVPKSRGAAVTIAPFVYFSNQGKEKSQHVQLAIGYESPAQFSREFKRYFGDSPVSFVNSHGL